MKRARFDHHVKIYRRRETEKAELRAGYALGLGFLFRAAAPLLPCASGLANGRSQFLGELRELVKNYGKSKINKMLHL